MGGISRSARLPAVRQQLVDAAGRVGVQVGEHVAQVGPGAMRLSLAVCTRLMTAAARWPASSLPMNSQFFA